MPPLRDLLIVGWGGFLGSVGRYLLSGFATHLVAASRFPVGTLTVNALGSLAIGLIAGIIERHHILTPATRLLLITGVLGGFTTFSAFTFETLFLAREAKWLAAGGNVVAQVGTGLIAVWIGYAISRLG